jgi:hypothetical protein
MSMRKDWEAEKKKLQRMAISPDLFRGDFGAALDAYEDAEKKVVKLKGSNKKTEFEAAKRDRITKAGAAALIARTYEGILNGLTATPMQKKVIEDALTAITGMMYSMNRPI